MFRRQLRQYDDHLAVETMVDTDKNTRPRVLIADDHNVVAEALRSLLEKEYEVIGTVPDGRKLLDEAPRLKPDVVVLDISMPLLNGLDAATRLRGSMPALKLVFLTMKADPNLAAAAMNLGAVGFVLKSDASSELLKAVSSVLNGKAYITPRVRPEDWAQQEVRARQHVKDLTPRQEEVLQLLAEGRSMKEIAGILSVSEKTVEFHKYHIMETFHLKNNAEIVRFAIERNLIS